MIKESNIELITTVDKSTIEIREFYPEDREERFKFRFYCPICLRYFNSMLISQCCYNYLCQYCTDDMTSREKKDKDYKASCPFSCNISPDLKFKLIDVTDKDKLKKYSDSQ